MQKIKYLLLGGLLVLLVFLFLSASKEISNSGKYQLSVGEVGAFVIDTETGVVKKVYGTGEPSARAKQLGIPFSEMVGDPAGY